VNPRTRTWLAAAAIVVALGVVVGGQAIADATAPEVPNGALTGQAVRRAGFAYLTGLRQFAAAMLWNRLDPLMHEYYGAHAGLGRMSFMLPSVRVITLLDPQFVEGYYTAPEILIEGARLPGTPPEVAKDRIASGIALALEGVTNNPRSGELITSYDEYLLTLTKDLSAAVRYADMAMAPGIVWRSDEERFDGIAIVRAVYEKAGLTDKQAAAQAIMTAIQNDPNATRNPVDSD
jgi:hypothetical protein